MSFIIDNTPREIFFRGIVRHRLNTNLELLVNGGVAVAGDAAHPSTPNMGQGGCMALEDAVVLTQKLYGALRTPPITDQETSEALPEHERINQALVEFQRERYERTNYISTRSYRIGRMIHTGWAVVDFFRDWFLIPLVYNKNRFLSHTLFDVGKLPGQLS
jgi:2-polyprenyl-6-methoxyphenol hydroxylase-like FAD-dependent oxidoreductase